MIKAVVFDVGETLVDETRNMGLGPTGSEFPATRLFPYLAPLLRRARITGTRFRCFSRDLI